MTGQLAAYHNEDDAVLGNSREPLLRVVLSWGRSRHIGALKAKGAWTELAAKCLEDAPAPKWIVAQFGI